jgi:hypothetical protein
VLEARELGEETQVLLQAVCGKFLFGEETLALGTHFFQALRHLHPSEKFWASSCLLVAGKACELDRNVPYLNRYQRYADRAFAQADYEAAERLICESLGFDLQLATFVSFLDFFLSRGVLAPTDRLDPALVDSFEAAALALSREFLRKGTFSKHQPELLALSIVKQTRELFKLAPWTEELRLLTGREAEEIPSLSCREPVFRELREISYNNAERAEKEKAAERPMEKTLPRRKYDKPQFVSVGRHSALKENSFSTSKVGLLGRKPSQPLVENFSTLNMELLRRR